MIVVVMPSRGRPRRAAEAIQAIRDTAVRVDTSVVLAVDRDDPELDRYLRLQFVGFGPEVTTVTLAAEETGDLVKATNTVSMRIARENPDSIIANFGDDHIARTPGWDRRVREALAEPGIAYGDDLIHGEHLPTAPFISASIVNALGWYALPTCHHLYIDDVWRELGQRTGCLRYLSDVVIEHMHPAVGKAEPDDGYERANSALSINRDHRAYIEWLKSRHYTADLRNVRRALRQAVAA